MKTLKIRPLWSITLLAALLVAPMALAQPPGPQGGPGFDRPGDGPGFAPGPRAHRGHQRLHDLRFLARFLELTDEQIEQARALFEGAREDARPIREEMRNTRQELKELLESAAPDATQVGLRVLEIHDLRGQLRDARETLFEDFRGLLTPEQLEKLDTFLEAREARRERRGNRGFRGDGA